MTSLPLLWLVLLVVGLRTLRFLSHFLKSHVISSLACGKLCQTNQVMSDHVKSCHVESYQVMSCHAKSCRVMPCHAMSCMPCHAMSCHVMPCHAMSCLIVAILCHVIPVHSVMPCYAIHDQQTSQKQVRPRFGSSALCAGCEPSSENTPQV